MINLGDGPHGIKAANTQLAELQAAGITASNLAARERRMTRRQETLLVTMTPGVRYSPKRAANLLCEHGVWSSPSAAAKALRDLARRGLVECHRDYPAKGVDSVVMTNDRDKAMKQGIVNTTLCFAYNLP